MGFWGRNKEKNGSENSKKLLEDYLNDEIFLLAKSEDSSDSNEEFYFPSKGQIVEMENIPDPVFSEGMLGICRAVLPEEGIVYAPCDGKICMIADTKHAIGVISKKTEKELLIHVGIDTVTMNGNGFEPLVKIEDKVHRGQPILKFDIATIKKANLSEMVIVAVQNE